MKNVKLVNFQNAISYMKEYGLKRPSLLPMLILNEVSKRDGTDVERIARTYKKRPSQLYYMAGALTQKGLLDSSDGALSLSARGIALLNLVEPWANACCEIFKLANYKNIPLSNLLVLFSLEDNKGRKDIPLLKTLLYNNCNIEKPTVVKIANNLSKLNLIKGNNSSDIYKVTVTKIGNGLLDEFNKVSTRKGKQTKP